MAVPKKILECVRSTKPLSESAYSLLEIVSDPDHSFREVIRVVESDVILTGSLLRVVNSAAYSLRSKIDTVQRAVTLAGENMVIGMALGLCADHLFNDPLEGYESEQGELWRHSLWTAIASREIARFSKDRVNPESAYTAGMLHDIGKAVISTYLKESAGNEVRIKDKEKAGYYLDAERKITGTDHTEVGGALIEMWCLPGSLKEAAACHHSPADASKENRPLVYVVHLGDFVSIMGGTGTGSDALLAQLDDRYEEYVNLATQDLEDLVFHVGQEFDNTLQALFVGERKYS